MAVLHVRDDFSCNPVYTKSYKGGHGMRVSPISYGKDEQGFVAGFGHYVRGVECFKYTPDREQPFQSLGFHRPCDKHASDVLSVATYDWTQNGQDDLFIGWGAWDYFAPALMTLKEGIPAKHRLITQDPVGKTRLAVSSLNGKEAYLIAASKKSHWSQGDAVKGYGLRIWRLIGDEPERVCYRHGNYTNIATGRIEDQDIFALTRRGMKEGQRSGRLHLEIFTYTSDEKLTRLWHATFDKRDKEKKKPSATFLRLTDANNDGKQELLCRINDRGVLVFQCDQQ